MGATAKFCFFGATKESNDCCTFKQVRSTPEAVLGRRLDCSWITLEAMNLGFIKAAGLVLEALLRPEKPS